MIANVRLPRVGDSVHIAFPNGREETVVPCPRSLPIAVKMVTNHGWRVVRCGQCGKDAGECWCDWPKA